ncbi:MAG: YidC/Oxa1 family membrane protein insertase [Clostridiales bacterium]|nr:YidC/Oxa1 family membrane protein insertase [Clostridiales bacterium]
MNDFLKSILDGIHMLIPSYGWALVAFTVLIKVCLLPLDYKSRKGMRKMSALAPKQAELQKKYGHDQEKLQRKMSELYKKEGASPMSGCWPMLISMPILFAMFAAMRYMANEQLVKQTFDILLTGEPVLEPFLWVKNLWMPDSPFAAAWPNLQSLQMVDQKQWLAIFNTLNSEQISQLAATINVPELTAASFDKGEALKGTIQAIGNVLTAMPAYTEQISVVPYLRVNLLITEFAVVKGFNGFFILPVLSAVSQFFFSKLTEANNPQPAPKTDANGQPQPNTGAFMKWFFPIFSLWICASSTAAFAVYWVVSNLFSLLSTQLMNWKLDQDEKKAAENPAAPVKSSLK